MRKTLAEDSSLEKFKLLEAMMDATLPLLHARRLLRLWASNWTWHEHSLDGVPHTIILEYKKLTKLVDPEQPPQKQKWNAAKNPKLPWYEPVQCAPAPLRRASPRPGPHTSSPLLCINIMSLVV